ncbi:major facilitator superfamily protein [Striga asiatica]|uniref:Major facilitator superfamily protein n=1 Tax=Striga asiatica TaxID=4170 RepID=A0A5A7NWB9_STRAF|nr:major facilitator superfamily protein [Striga asiatica]
MADGNQDIENGENRALEEIRAPLIAGDDDSGRSLKGKSCEEERCMVYLSTFVAVCGSYAFGSCAGYSSPTQAAIREDVNLSLAEYSLFGSILTFGAMIGAITSGKIADFIGRKGAMIVSSLFCTAGWLSIYFAQGPVPLDVGRLATGYGMGVFSYVVPVFIAELAPKDLRGALTTINQLMICTGVSVSFIIGTLLTWRALALVGIIPCAVLLFGLCIIPESPRWLAKQGKQKEFEASLRRLRGKNADISAEAAEIQLISFLYSNKFGLVGQTSLSHKLLGTFVLYAVVNALAILFVIEFVPETKGRTLEQIQAAVNAS